MSSMSQANKHTQQTKYPKNVVLQVSQPSRQCTQQARHSKTHHQCPNVPGPIPNHIHSLYQTAFKSHSKKPRMSQCPRFYLQVCKQSLFMRHTNHLQKNRNASMSPIPLQSCRCPLLNRHTNHTQKNHQCPMSQCPEPSERIYLGAATNTSHCPMSQCPEPSKQRKLSCPDVPCPNSNHSQVPVMSDVNHELLHDS